MSEGRKRLEDYLDLFMHPMWKQLMVELAEDRDTLNNLYSVENERQLQFRKGELARLENLIAFEAMVRNELKMLDAGAEEDEFETL